MNIVMKGVVNKTEEYRGFTISWQEPPQTSAAWTANAAAGSPRLQALMACPGAKVIDGGNREEMIAKAKRYIDRLLD